MGLLQGLGQDVGCKNVTANNFNFSTNSSEKITYLVPESISPNFSVSTYFCFMFLMLTTSLVAFSLLNYSKVAKKERKKEIVANLDEEMKSMTDSTKFSKNHSLKKETFEKIILLFMIFVLSFINYGILPG